MKTIIALIPALPLLSFLILVLFGGKLSRRVAGWIGAGSIGIAALLTGIAGIDLMNTLPDVKSYSVVLWQWMHAGNLSANIASVSIHYHWCFVL